MVMFNPKVKTLFRRGSDHKVINEFTDDRYTLIAPEAWVLTEKMDGMSVIITLDDYYGRSANTNFRVAEHEFLSALQKRVSDDARSMGLDNLAVYGELVGPGVNGNHHGFDELKLFVFDMRINDFWLDWGPMLELARDLKLTTVRQLSCEHGQYSAITYCKAKHDHYVEGVVARTDPYLYDNQGNRVIFKLKCKDF